jgi:colicin import membrane protein
MDFDLYKRRRGIIGTTLFHLIIFTVLFFYHFSPADPVFPDPDGIMVNFGDSESGSGYDEPEKTSAPESEPAPAAEAQSSPAEPAAQPEPAPVPETESVLTQDMEDAPALAEQKKKQQEAEKIKAAEEAAKKKTEEDAKRREAEQRKREEQERKRIEEEERKKREAEQRRIEELNNRARTAFGAAANSQAASEGTAAGQGNQGKPEGHPDASSYDKGVGKGAGIDWTLDGRSAISVPRPPSGVQVEGRVVVEIFVDKEGNVIDARPGVIGTTTSDARLYELARNAALKAKFDVSPNSPERQRGRITYIFDLK